MFSVFHNDVSFFLAEIILIVTSTQWHPGNQRLQKMIANHMGDYEAAKGKKRKDGLCIETCSTHEKSGVSIPDL